MFHSPFGPSSGFCIKLLKIKSTTIHKIYTFCEITVEVYIMRMFYLYFQKFYTVAWWWTKQGPKDIAKP